MAPNDFETFCEENSSAIAELVGTFSDYEPLQGVDRSHFQKWLRQFDPQHRALALKLASKISYYSIKKLNGLMTSLHEIVNDQVRGVSPNEVFYVPFGRVGESGSDIARRFRNVNHLQAHKTQFIDTIEIQQRIFKLKTPTVIFLDDFIATGKQVTDAWNETLSQIVPEYIGIYLAVVAAFSEGVKKIESETPIKVISVHTIGPKHQLMESAFQGLSKAEKGTVKKYCDDVGNEPLGFGSAGLLVSFAYGTPNNTISVVRGSVQQKPWKGLLPLWEDL